MENFLVKLYLFLVLLTIAVLSQSQQVQGSPSSPFLDAARESRQGASAGIAQFLNGFVTGLTSAFQGGVSGAGALFNGFGSAANSTFSGLLSGYNSTANGLVHGASSFIGSNGNRTQ